MARRQSGVLDLFGGLALGLSQSMQANRDAGLKQEFLKAQMDEAKAKAKHYEAQVKANLMKQEMQGNLMRFMQGGMQPGGPQAQGLAPGAPPPMHPQEIPAPQQGAPAAPMAPMSGGGGGSGGGRVNFGGIDFTGYAEDPNWPNAVGSILKQIPAIASGKDIDTVIANYAPNSPLIGQGDKIFQLAQQGGYDPRLPIAIGIQESALGTKGLATKTRNPWNIGGDSPDQRYYFSDVGQGVDAFHNWTMRRKGQGGQQPDVTQQIAQAQTNNQMQAQQAVGQTLAQVPANKSGNLDIKSMSMQERTMLDLAFKTAFDLDTGFRKDDTQVRGDMEKGFGIFQNGELIKTIPGAGRTEMVEGVDPSSGLRYKQPMRIGPAGAGMRLPTQLPSVKQQEITNPDGSKSLVPYNADVPGGPLPGPLGGGMQSGGIMKTAPSPAEMPGTLPDAVKTKLSANQTTLDYLNILQENFRPEYLGMKGAAGGVVDKYGGMVGMQGDPKRASFKQIFSEVLGQKLLERGGSALTKQELNFIQNTLPRLTQSPEVFKTGVEAAKLLLQASNYELQASHLTPDKQKFQASANKLMDQYQSLKKDLMPYISGGNAPVGKVSGLKAEQVIG